MTDVETVLARAAARAGAVLAAPVTLTALALRGPSGALAALAGVVLVAGVVALTGRSLSWAARHGLSALLVVALGGFALRLSGYAVGVALLRDIAVIDGHVLAVAVAVSAIVVLSVEARVALLDRRLWWVDAAAQGRM